MSATARHFQRKAPRKTRGFAWARVPDRHGDLVTYRLSRGDARNALHCEQQTFTVRAPRDYIAAALWSASSGSLSPC